MMSDADNTPRQPFSLVTEFGQRHVRVDENTNVLCGIYDYLDGGRRLRFDDGIRQYDGPPARSLAGVDEVAKAWWQERKEHANQAPARPPA